MMRNKRYKVQKESVDKVCDQIAMTSGMSDSLLNSGLLSQISGLSTQDKQCLIRYISEEVEVEQLEEDEWDLQDTSNLEPYTLEELYARIDESHQQYLRGEYVTSEESDAMLKEEFPWLQ
jgi:hypothetical protein